MGCRIGGPAGSRPALCTSQLHPEKPHAGDMADFLLALPKCVGTPRAVPRAEDVSCSLNQTPWKLRDFTPPPKPRFPFFPEKMRKLEFAAWQGAQDCWGSCMFTPRCPQKTGLWLGISIYGLSLPQFPYL